MIKGFAKVYSLLQQKRRVRQGVAETRKPESTWKNLLQREAGNSVTHCNAPRPVISIRKEPYCVNGEREREREGRTEGKGEGNGYSKSHKGGRSLRKLLPSEPRSLLS